MLEWCASVAWYHGSVVEEVQYATAMTSEHDLLLGTLDGGGEMEIVGFLELLASL